MGYDISGGRDASSETLAVVEAVDALMGKIGQAEAAQPEPRATSS